MNYLGTVKRVLIAHFSPPYIGFCTAGFLISAEDLLNKNPNPTELEVREGLSGNLCRCTGYVGIVEAVLEVALARAHKNGREHA